MTTLVALETTLTASFWILVLLASVLGIIALVAPRLVLSFGAILQDFEAADEQTRELEAKIARLVRFRASLEVAKRLRSLDHAADRFVPTWQLPSPLETLRTATLGDLLALPSIGPVRARRIIDAGENLTHQGLTKILGRSKVPSLYFTIREDLRKDLEVNHPEESEPNMHEAARLQEAICDWAAHIEREWGVSFDEVVEGHRDAWESLLPEPV